MPQTNRELPCREEPKNSWGPWDLKRFLSSFHWASRGIAYLFLTQQNARVQLLVGVAAVLGGSVLGLNSGEWALLALAIAAVISAEATNTVVEVTLDHLSPQQHYEVQKAKDIAAGSVLIASLGALAVGVIIFAPKIIARMTGHP